MDKRTRAKMMSNVEIYNAIYNGMWGNMWHNGCSFVYSTVSNDIVLTVRIQLEEYIDISVRGNIQNKIRDQILTQIKSS